MKTDRYFQMSKQNTRLLIGTVSDTEYSYNKDSSEWTSNGTLYSHIFSDKEYIVYDSVMCAMGQWK